MAVLTAYPVPNPQTGPVYRFGVRLSANTGEIHGKLYSKSMVMVAHLDFEGMFNAGWNGLIWRLPDLKNGVYYVRFTTDNRHRGAIAKLMILH